MKKKETKEGVLERMRKLEIKRLQEILDRRIVFTHIIKLFKK